MHTRVYVDDAAIPFHGHRMYHMFSRDLDALHDMADRIGMPRRHFQDPATMPKVSWPHYDIAHPLRIEAIAQGATEVDRFQFVAMAGVIRGKLDPLAPFRSLYYREQCRRLEAWLQGEGLRLEVRGGRTVWV